MKVSELTGAQLDHWVAMALGYASVDAIPDDVVGTEYHPHEAGRLPWRPSRSWEQGGPIIERERIDLEFMDEASWCASISEWRQGWRTEHLHDVASAYGSTPLIAAMRAYVASKFGEEVPGVIPSA